MADYEKWWAIAEREIQAAECLGQAGLYAEACFWCQQSVEKALKALLIFQGKEFSKNHSLIALAKQAGVLSRLKEWIVDLDADYAATRYVVLIEDPSDTAYNESRFKKRFDYATESLQLVQTWMKT